MSRGETGRKGSSPRGGRIFLGEERSGDACPGGLTSQGASSSR